MNIGMLLLVIIGGMAGLLSTGYLMVSIPLIITYKIYRKVRYGISIMN